MRKFLSGFTLIELIVAMALLVLTATISINWVKLTQNRKLKNTLDNIKLSLQFAMAESILNQEPVQIIIDNCTSISIITGSYNKTFYLPEKTHCNPNNGTYTIVGFSSSLSNITLTFEESSQISLNLQQVSPYEDYE